MEDKKKKKFGLQFGELPYHMVRARRFQDLYKHVLFNYEWLHAKLSSCPLQAVLSDFEDACANIEDREAVRYVQDLGSNTFHVGNMQADTDLGGFSFCKLDCGPVNICGGRSFYRHKTYFRLGCQNEKN